MAKSLHTQEWNQLLDELIAVRVSSGVTQIQLGDLIGRTQSFVSKVERGERSLDVIEFCEWVNNLGVRPSAFLEKLEKTVLIAKKKEA